MKEIARSSLLLDYYGGLLTDKQREIYDLYYQQDLSLGEIADIQQVSRNAVYDVLVRTNDKLENYEKVLSLIAADQKDRQAKAALLKDWQSWQAEVRDQLKPLQQKQLTDLIKRLEQG
jgi:predicted DNA-binding protein YlxM (UPF0122 family)